jgi:hypothetical protein
MAETLALLGGASTKKNRGGRPSKASMGMNHDDFPGWAFFRACVVLYVVEHGRAAGKTRKEAAISAVFAWKNLFPMGRLSTTEVDSILREYQPEGRPDAALRVDKGLDSFPESVIVDGKLRLTGRYERRPVWVMRFDDRPPYPKRGSGRKPKMRFSQRFK